jgi:hypothetical protein
MGIKQSELIPIGSIGPTATTPVAKVHVSKTFVVSRTDASPTLKCVLPADASISGVKIYGSVVSNAVTTATLTISAVSQSGTISTGTVDVKANGATTALVQMSSLPNIEPVPLAGDLQINGSYADTGGAATLGGPWNVEITYVR